MISLKKILTELEDYRGSHEAPDRQTGSPLYDVTGIYPQDIYTEPLDVASRYYGSGEPFDSLSISTIRAYKDKPNLSIKIYRAIPLILTTQDQIEDLEKQKKYILKYGRIPSNINTKITDRSAYYDYIDDTLKKLRNKPNKQQQKITINDGDWVTINKQYAVEHGKSSLLGKYKILSKVVKARHLYTDGNSLHEWGYDSK